ncbi:MAG: hypothetical protein IJ087_22170, partial [Eggerthellaceae bacterium]|nr:hypothetical protein [Eggerthellaceae bacterium]
MWHSIGDPDNSWSGQNQIGIIEGTAENPVYQVYKFDKSGKGAIALEMASGDESITSGNDGYRLENAVFGVFASRSDAQTHDASKAIKTYSTDSQGTFETDREFAEGTYYVAETTAPLGYALDNGVYEVVVVSDQTAKVNGGALASIPLLGGIRLEKRSANPEITGNNSCYSLEGAEYGLFATSDDATTHDSSKATAQFATTQDGTFESELAWPAGTYYVAETKAAQGFALDEHVYATRIEAGKRTDVNSPEGFTSAFALHNPIVSWSAVRDAETQDGSAQGSATLAGATFQVSYYDGYYDSASLPSAPTRSWLVKTDADGTAWARDDLKASGDEFYRIDGEHIVLPLGTVTVTETQASQGYLEPPAEPQLMLVEPGTSGAELDSYTAPVISSSVERGGVAAGLVDRQNAKHLAQGSATLAGAVFEILSDNDRQVVVNGSSFAKGDVVGSIETELTDEERYIARTPDTWLPAGSYILRQTEAGKGYLLDDTSLAWRKSFAVAGQGDVTDLTQPDSCATNQVIRGDFRFSKADGVTDARLALIPFLVTSQTTGEQHVIMTDENGMASTANSWNAHEHLTNANDLAASPSSDAEGGYAVDESKLDPTAGAWFDGRADESVATTAVLGALPYDTYTVSELRVAANAGYELATFTANVTRNDLELDLGTVDGNPIQPAGEKADDSKTTPEPAQG